MGKFPQYEFKNWVLLTPTDMVLVIDLCPPATSEVRVKEHTKQII
jgi:hypothetical protein